VEQLLEGWRHGLFLRMLEKMYEAQYDKLQLALERHYRGSPGDREELEGTGARAGQLGATEVRGRLQRGQLVRRDDGLRLWLVDGGEEVAVPPAELRALCSQFGALPGAAVRAVLAGPRGGAPGDPGTQPRPSPGCGSSVLESVGQIALLAAMRDGVVDTLESGLLRGVTLARYAMALLQLVMFAVMLGHCVEVYAG
jgi:hypothetical protein